MSIIYDNLIHLATGLVIICLAALLAHGIEYIEFRAWWALLLLILLTCAVITMTVIIWRQPQNSNYVTFKVSLSCQGQRYTYSLTGSESFFNLQSENIQSYNLFSLVMMITWWMKLGGNLPLGHDVLLFSMSGSGSFIYPVAQTRLDKGFTKAFIYPVAQTRLDKAFTKAFIYPVAQTRLDKAFTKAFIYPVTQTQLDKGFTKAFIYPVALGGKSKCSCTRQIWTTALSALSVLCRQPPDHDDRPKSEDQLYTGSSTGDLLPIGGIVCENWEPNARASQGCCTLITLVAEP